MAGRTIVRTLGGRSVSQILQLVGGVEDQGGELPQTRGVDLTVGRRHARMPLDGAFAALPAAQGDCDAYGGPASAAHVATPTCAIAEFVDVLSVGGGMLASESSVMVHDGARGVDASSTKLLLPQQVSSIQAAARSLIGCR